LSALHASLRALPRLEVRVAIVTVAVFVVFDRAAAWTGSVRGEAGLAICALVLALLFRAERWLTERKLSEIARSLGLGPCAPRALGVAVLLCAALLAFFPLFSRLTGTPLAVRADAAALALGIFAQAGIAEETLFRGFLFRHLRARRPFWRAASLAAVPFVAAHLLLFATLDFTIALAALLVAVSLTFPLARLFDLAGGAIWPGALLHAVVQGAIKFVEPVAGDSLPLALGWMAASAALPWAVFALRAPSPRRKRREAV
jgi:membrane protease YdiL (CAAX protease family)